MQRAPCLLCILRVDRAQGSADLEGSPSVGLGWVGLSWPGLGGGLRSPAESPGILLEHSSGLGLRFCISNKLWGDTDAAVAGRT